MISSIIHNNLTITLINYILFLIALCLTGIMSVIIHAVIRVWLDIKLRPKNKIIFLGGKEEVKE